MELTKQEHIFDESLARVSVTHQSTHWLILNAQLFSPQAKYATLLETLLQEFIDSLIEQIWDADFDYRRFKSFFEFSLQELNSQLTLFAQKSHEVWFISIKWIIEVYFEREYTASLIGETGLVILRHGKVYYRLDNDVQKRQRISLFSDFLEWDIHNRDQIIICGTQLGHLIDDADIHDIEDVVGIQDKSFAQLLHDLLLERAAPEVIGFQLSHNIIVPTWSQFFAPKKNKYTSFLIDYSKEIWIWVFVMIALFLLVSLIKTYSGQRSDIVLSNGNSWSLVNFSLEDIKRQISSMQWMDASDPAKPVLYRQIVNRLDMLAKSWKLSDDVKALQWIVQSEYDKWFNISRVTDLGTKIYEILPSDKSVFGEPIRLVPWRWSYHIYWSQAAVIGNVSENIKGTMIKYGDSIAWWASACASDLQWAWLYCRNTWWSMLNISKAWATTVKVWWQPYTFPTPIKDVGVFGKTNMYVLTSNSQENAQWIHVIRFPALGSSSTEFRNAMPYAVSWDTNKYMSMSIDGTFVLRWSWLYQLSRDGTTTNLRTIPMKWGDWLWETYGTGTKVFSFANSKYIYLYNPKYQSITVYTSEPLKTNPSNTTIYTLTYFMRLVFSWRTINDLIIMDWANPTAYILDPTWVFKFSLADQLTINEPKR